VDDDSPAASPQSRWRRILNDGIEPTRYLPPMSLRSLLPLCTVFAVLLTVPASGQFVPARPVEASQYDCPVSLPQQELEACQEQEPSTRASVRLPNCPIYLPQQDYRACLDERVRIRRSFSRQQAQPQTTNNGTSGYVPNAGGYSPGSGGYTPNAGGYAQGSGYVAGAGGYTQDSGYVAGSGGFTSSSGYTQPQQAPFQANAGNVATSGPTSTPQQDADLPPPIPGPVTNPQPILPPVQSPRQNDTLDAVQPAASSPAPRSQVGEPAVATLSPPRLIAPTNPGELAPIVPLEWSPVSGAAYYQLAVRNLSTNEFVVDRTVYTTSYTSQPYAAGTSFRWNVRACNQNGCSRWSEAWGFRTGATATVPSGALTYGDVLTQTEQLWFFPYFEYLRALPNGQSVTVFPPEMIARMKSSSRWESFSSGALNDIRSFDYCGSGRTQFYVPDAIGRSNISLACRRHDACYGSTTSRLTCDTNIRNDVMSECYRQGESRTKCAAASSMFYVGLRLFGWFYKQ